MPARVYYPNLSTMKTISILTLILLFALSCDKKKKTVAAFVDYAPYLTISKASSDLSKEELRFWNGRLVQNQDDDVALVKLAGLYAERFKTTGQIQDILLSDSLYHSSFSSTLGGNVDILHCLATNAITQHKFRLAKDYAEKALAIKDKKAATLLILTDVSLELGDYARATRTLKQFKNKKSFAYLIREVKLKDHEGKLDTAIILMEQAYQRIRGNRALAQWTLSNLADMYGHAGRIEEAYRTYLTVLKIDPHNDYALKGIAWIAFSNDGNASDAKKIMTALASRKRMPEAYLMLAEIASVERNEAEKLLYLQKFLSLVDQPTYKTMYHKYLATIKAEDLKNPEACIAIAKEEIVNRPTPQSYDLLAWGYYNQQNFEKALDVAQRNVEEQTFEPDAYYHLGMIYLASGDKQKSKQYLKEAQKSEFELGPSISEKITEALKKL